MNMALQKISSFKTPLSGTKGVQPISGGAS